MKMNLANDLGNGSMKLLFNSRESVKLPSVISVERDQDVFAPVEFSNQEQKDAYMNDLMNQMDISLQTPSVRSTRRQLVGVSAVNSGLATESFDVNDYSGKSTTDLAMILTLGAIANKGLQDAYFENDSHEVPHELDIQVSMTTALPIVEGKQNNVVQEYRDKYTKTQHTVNLYNFEHPVTVRISFDLVVVALEGETAQYEIRNAPDTLADGIDADFAKHYADLYKEIGPRALIKSSNSLGIDIGEGTTDIPVFTNGKLNVHASSSLSRGYGNVLEGAMAALRSKQFSVNSRAELQDLVTKQASPLLKGRQQIAKQAVSEQLQNLVSEINNEVSGVLRNASNGVEVIFVYGGGAVPMEPVLRDSLYEKTKAFTNGLGIPVVFVPKAYAQYLNNGGLDLILTRIQQAKAAGK